VRLRALAPAKVNLCLFLGPLRADGRHELVTLFESVSIADELELSTLAEQATDEVVCPGVEGPNLVAAALEGLRAAGWDAPPVRIEIRKRVPVAAGMGGGSADAAATLRLAGRVAPVGEEAIDALAASLGADVPSQIRPGLTLGIGAGDLVQRMDPLAPHAFLVLPQSFGLSTVDVYKEADRLRLPRPDEELASRWHELSIALATGSQLASDLPAELLVNDLEPAALSVRPEIGSALDAIRLTGADHAMVCGSGPTVAGLYWGPDAEARAGAGVGALAGTFAAASVAVPVGEASAAPQHL
jgi:4-diphosphocytidyl-2-C-methyl-D-erythritol kinase